MRKGNNLSFSIITGIHKPVGSLDVENKIGGGIGGGLKYNFKNKSSLNILQINSAGFTKSVVNGHIDQRENGKFSNILMLLTGYSYPIFKRIFIGGNIGIGFIGQNRMNRVSKFGVNPVVSFKASKYIHIDVGYLNFWAVIEAQII